MKKQVTVSIIVLLVLGFGFFLFKISPQTQNGTNSQNNFNLGNIDSMSAPSEVKADDHVLGNPEAKNTIVAYEDLQCPACANFEPILQSLPAELKDTKVVFRHFPLLSIHKNASLAAIASEAAAAQGRFWEFVNLMYSGQDKWSNLSDPSPAIIEIAKQSGIANIEQFSSDLSSQKYKDRVERDLREATGLKVGGTPSLYFNGVPLELGGVEAIKQQVEKLYK